MRTGCFKLFLIGLVFVASGRIHGQTGLGAVDTFLASNPDATIEKQTLGSFKGTNQAELTLRAIVAKNPAHPASEVKGLEIQLSAEGQTIIKHLDDVRRPDSARDSLTEFEAHLSHLAMHRSDFAPGDLRLERTTIAGANEPVGPRPYPCRKCHLFNLGIYRRGSETGITLDIPGDPVFTIAFFPDITREQIVDIIKAGRQWLDSN